MCTMSCLCVCRQQESDSDSYYNDAGSNWLHTQSHVILLHFDVQERLSCTQLYLSILPTVVGDGQYGLHYRPLGGK